MVAVHPWLFLWLVAQTLGFIFNYSILRSVFFKQRDRKIWFLRILFIVKIFFFSVISFLKVFSRKKTFKFFNSKIFVSENLSDCFCRGKKDNNRFKFQENISSRISSYQIDGLPHCQEKAESFCCQQSFSHQIPSAKLKIKVQLSKWTFDFSISSTNEVQLCIW